MSTLKRLVEMPELKCLVELSFEMFQMASDLLDGIDSNQLGDDERSYRREQAIFWLVRAAERGSKVK